MVCRDVKVSGQNFGVLVYINVSEWKSQVEGNDGIEVG